ncbi:MAG: glycosyl transferase family 1 [Patescibacteria group bacterium]|nr:MAG: glycosyl transferase family 1 [Patescibacteria group bacterium]
MIVIGIDGNEANIAQRVGVNIYAFNLLQALHKLQDEISKDYRFVIYLAEKPLPDMPKEVKGFWEYKIIPGKGLWIIKKLMPYLWLNKDHIDLLFTPSHYTVPLLPISRVVSITDLGYLEFSEQFEKKVFWQLKYWSAISIFVSKGIIAISKNTADDILRHYPFASKKIKVTHLAYDNSRFYFPIPKKNVRQVKRKYKIDKNYILYLGTLKPSKNVEGLIDAFDIVSKDFPDLQLVIAGKKGWLFESIFKKVESLGLERKVIFTDFISEDDKAPLMAGASVFVCPSFWEGFGLIALEAMACGTPVVVSNIASFPEVVGDAGILVDPYKKESIAKGISKVLKMNSLEYNKLVEAGLKQAALFSWEKTAKETLSFLKDIVKK